MGLAPIRLGKHDQTREPRCGEADGASPINGTLRMDELMRDRWSGLPGRPPGSPVQGHARRRTPSSSGTGDPGGRPAHCTITL